MTIGIPVGPTACEGCCHCRAVSHATDCLRESADLRGHLAATRLLFETENAAHERTCKLLGSAEAESASLRERLATAEARAKQLDDDADRHNDERLDAEDRARAALAAAAALREQLAEVRRSTIREIAAYALDRGDQYDTDDGRWVPLADVAHALMDGEFEAAVAHGELDADIFRRVDNWRNK